MAVYAATVTLAAGNRHAQRLAHGNKGMIMVDINITNYNSTLAEITGVSKYFQNLEAIVPLGPSDAGYSFSYIDASKSLKAWDSVNSGGMTQVSDDTDVGSVRCLAFGVI